MAAKIDGNGYFSPFPPFGQCRLNYVNSTTISLTPYNGNRLSIGQSGDYYTVPNAGVTLSSSGLTAGTTYNIYAYISGGNITLEASTTARTTDTVTGIQIKTGDSTRTLVGKAYVGSGTVFLGNTGNKLVLSWFNRRRDISSSTTGSNIVTATTTPSELTSSARAYGLCWGDEVVDFSAYALMQPSAAGLVVFSQGILYTNTGGVDNVVAGSSVSYFQGQPTVGANTYGSGFQQASVIPTETLGSSTSLIYASQYAWCNSATNGTWFAGCASRLMLPV